jgi:uncharacterized protein YjlB
MEQPKQYFIKDNGIFPNSIFPVLHYQKVLNLPPLFPAAAIKRIFKKNNWTNNWKYGVYTYNHYHSTTHEVIGVCQGKAVLQLGGDNGTRVTIEKGDVLVIPAGVAHKNLGKEKDVICVGGYPDGRDYDMNYGRPEERPQADRNIRALPLPESDPVFGSEGGLIELWKSE